MWLHVCVTLKTLSWVRAESACKSGRRNYRTRALCMGCAEGLQAAARCFQFGKAAALLLQKIKFDVVNVFCSGEDLLPFGVAFSEQDFVFFGRIGRPLLQVKGADSSRVGANPCYGIKA